MARWCYNSDYSLVFGAKVLSLTGGLILFLSVQMGGVLASAPFSGDTELRKDGITEIRRHQPSNTWWRIGRWGMQYLLSEMRKVLSALWQLTLSSFVATRQTSNKFGLRSLLRHFCVREWSNVPRTARYFTERGELLYSAYGMLTLEHRYAYEWIIIHNTSWRFWGRLEVLWF